MWNCMKRPYPARLFSREYRGASGGQDRTARREAGAAEVIAHPGGVAILPYHDDGTVTVVRQFRYPFGRVVTELPAGSWSGGGSQGLRPAGAGGGDGLTAGTLTYLGGLLASPDIPTRCSTVSGRT